MIKKVMLPDYLIARAARELETGKWDDKVTQQIARADAELIRLQLDEELFFPGGEDPEPWVLYRGRKYLLFDAAQPVLSKLSRAIVALEEIVEHCELCSDTARRALEMKDLDEL